MLNRFKQVDKRCLIDTNVLTRLHPQRAEQSCGTPLRGVRVFRANRFAPAIREIPAPTTPLFSITGGAASLDKRGSDEHRWAAPPLELIGDSCERHP
jgi:hypothetical protein